jgi:leucyl/phenylalanyl-tRNA--protein transferase
VLLRRSFVGAIISDGRLFHRTGTFRERHGWYPARVPVEPPTTPWMFPPVSTADENDLVAVGADLEPGTVLDAYRRGLFPMPVRRRGPIGWWSPDPRAVLELEALRVPRSLRQSAKRFEIRVDTAFDEVMVACADPGRPHGWIDKRVLAAYRQLHALGWAHSVEAWDRESGALAGGLYGVAIGAFFAGESMFHHQRDASKVALMALVEILRAGPNAGHTLLDVQWQTPHLESLGVHEMSRPTYLARLSSAVASASAWPETLPHGARSS